MIFTLLLAACLAGFSPGGFCADNRFMVLNYHDIEDDPDTQRLDDAVTLSSRQLAGHFDWLRTHGYTVVSLDDIIAAHEGRRPLPDKAVLLTFDDGYLSTYTRVFPLLKLYHYPAVIGLMTGWMEAAAGSEVEYGESTIHRRHFLTWSQVREMTDSGLVEIASHSNDLHHDIQAGPQNVRLPAATHRKYDPHNGRYEDSKAFQRRIRNDLKKSMDIIRRYTGRTPRALIWPYGSYNSDVIAVAGKLGMPVTMTLDDGSNSAADLSALKRIYIYDQMPPGELVRQLHGRYWSTPLRIVHVDLDMIYDPDPAQQDRNIAQLLKRIRKLHINTVYLQAYADPDGDGSADALYFPNRHLPVRADLFGRVANVLHERAAVKVYAWLPVLSFVVDDKQTAADQVTQAGHGNGPGSDYLRLSPFDDRARRIITDIYEDLAIHADFDGLLFHDDGVLSDYEDDSDSAHKVYAQQWDLPASVTEIRASPVLFERWTHLKTKWLTDWTLMLADTVRRYHPRIRTARNLYAEVVLHPESESWYAQSLDSFLASYDYTAVMAMPFMENARDPDAWLTELTERIATRPGALSKTVFELQALDWRSDTPVGDDVLTRQMFLLQYHGALNFGYYPDNYVEQHPAISTIIPAMSLQTFPYPEPEAGTR